MDRMNRFPRLKVAALGSTNPLKLRAVEATLREIDPEARVVAVRAGGDSPQPLTDAETLAGAERRALLALEASAADLGIGVESGVHTLEGVVYAGTWAVVVDRGGRRGTGSSGRIELPGWLTERLAEGVELEEAIHRATGLRDQGRGGGVLGLLTDGRITRFDAVREALHLALTAWSDHSRGPRTDRSSAAGGT